MKFRKLFLYAVLTAILAGLVALVTWQMNGFLIKGPKTPLTYITFCSWAVYFMVGSTPKAAVRALTSIIAGIIAAILMFVLSLAFGFSPWWAVPLAVVIMVVPMMLMERVRPFNNIAAVFVGTGLFFSLSAAGAIPSFNFKGYVLAALAELVYVFIGFLAGYLTTRLNLAVAKHRNK